MNIRFAKKEDVSELTKLSAMLADLHHNIDSYYRSSATYDHLRDDVASLCDKIDKTFIVAEEHGVVIAFIGIEIDAPEQYVNREIKRIGIIHSIYVEPKYQRRGIAKQLCEKTLEWFSKKQVRHIELSVDARNLTAHNVWKKLGFTDYKIRMRLDVEKK